jgi:hypothetical protein
MRWSRLAMMLTVLNFVLLLFLLAQLRPVSAEPIPSVLRGRALELVDDKGRVRAEIKVLPAQPDVNMPDGTRGMPETVQLRLIDSTGSPHVKLDSIEDGSGLVLGGQGGYLQLLSRGPRPFVKIYDNDKQQQTLTATPASSR